MPTLLRQAPVLAFGWSLAGDFCNLVGVNFLAPLGSVYGHAMGVRNWLYDRGVLRSHSLGARTISIGNLTAGGTGKTPLVALTASILADAGENVCVLTRGYGRENENERVLVSDGRQVLADAASAGDEPVELARKLLGKAAVIADADRVGAAEFAQERFGITAFVLDDGFQHRRAERDTDIVCVDATNPFGNGRVLPAGTLRESLRGIRRADAVVITRSDLVVSTDGLAAELKSRNRSLRIFRAVTRIRGFTRLDDLLADSQAAANDLANAAEFPFVFCGLGNPENFRRQIGRAGIRIAGFHAFRDHHRYTQADADHLADEAEKANASSLLTTVKDAVKFTGLIWRVPVIAAEAETELDRPDEFAALVGTGSGSDRAPVGDHF